eukprot:snap_masked-scaffold_4-processed-gene-1.29-mRNA-1 protein AED:1.00 eAED:1.00 QI:0/0/0/0/1/1/3/0/493
MKNKDSPAEDLSFFYDSDTETISEGEILLPTKKPGLDYSVHVKDEIYLFSNIALPVLFVSLLSQAVWFYSMTIVGSTFGTVYVGAFAMSNLCGVLLGKSFLIGILTAYDTLAGNAVGKIDYIELESVTKVALFFSICIMLLVELTWANIGFLLNLVGQDPEVISIVEKFMIYYKIMFPLQIVEEVVKRFYQSQNITLPFLILTILISVLHFPSVYFLSKRFGFDGVGYAHLVTQFLTSFSYLSYSIFYGYKIRHPNSWRGFFSRSLPEALSKQNIWNFGRLALPGVLSMSEWWFWDTVTIFVGTLGKEALAAQSVMNNIVTMAYMVPYGIATATQTRVSTFDGAQHTLETSKYTGKFYIAKIISVTALLVAFLLAVLYGSIVVLCKEEIVDLFVTQDEDAVREEASRTAMLLLPLCFFDSGQGVLMGILRGLGEHFKVGVSIFCCMWVFGLPFIIMFTKGRNESVFDVYVALTIDYAVFNLVLGWLTFSRRWS